MRKVANCIVLLASLWLVSCSRTVRTEVEEVAYWKARLVDPASNLLYNDKDTVRALHYFDSVLAQSPDAGVYPKAARCILIANYYYFFTPDNEATGRMIDSALALFQTQKLQEQYAQTYVTYLLFGGETAYRLSQYNKANANFFKAKKLADTRLTPCERKAFNYSIAMVLYQQQNFSASLENFKEAFAQQAACWPQTRAIVLQQQEIQSNIGLCLLQLKRYDSARVHFQKALEIAESNKDSLGAETMDKIYGVVYGNIAKVAIAQYRLDEAEQLSKKSIALNYRKGFELEDATKVMLQLAEVYKQKKDFVSMFALLGRLDATITTASQSTQLEWRRLMTSYYEQAMQPALALHFFKSYIALKDSMAVKQLRLTAADVERQLDDKEQAHQIASLKKDKQLTLTYLIVAAVVSFMAMLIIFLVYQNYRRSKRNLATLLELNQEIKRQKTAREEEAKRQHKRITKAVIKAQENERSLIGLELHDNINQVLTTVKLHNEMILDGIGDAQQLLPRASQYLQNCINEIRQLSKRLSAPTLGRISLEESVKDLIDSINQTSKVTIVPQVSGLENQLLKQDLHIGVYRILQEQLNNVLKHADASEVVVQLKRNNDTLYLSITDNGKGFVVPGAKNGIGLMNMQTRAENLNGTFNLQSKPGNGCKVEVVLPCMA